MAKNNNKSTLPTELSNAFKAVDKLNPDASILADNALSRVDDYIDTGSMALNAVVSGSLYKGVPVGRIVGLVGPTGCGKTLILNKIIANAQKRDPEVWGLIWDSESAHDSVAATNVGANPDKIKHMPVETVEECRNQILTFLDKIIDSKDLYRKVIIGIDSLGNLASTKEIEDARKGKTASDMGLRAKTIKSMMRSLTYKCAKAGVTLVFTNHIYDDPAAMFPSLVKNNSGGKGPMYLASLLIQLAVNQDKDKEDDEGNAIKIAKTVTKGTVKGVNLKALTVKNRFIPPFLETDLFLNFKTGLYKYGGLLEMATAYDIIKQSGPTYELSDGTKLGYYKNWKNNEEIWENKILPILEKTIQAEFAYSSMDDELTEEVKNLDAGTEETTEDSK